MRWDRENSSPRDSNCILIRALKAPLSSTREGCEMELRGCRDQRDRILCILCLEVVSVSHHHESFKILNRAIQHPSCPHNSSHKFVSSITISYMVHTHTHTKKSSCPEAVINAITDRVTGVSAGHSPQSVFQSHDQVQRWRSSCQSDPPSCSLTTEQTALSPAPSVCAFCTDLGFCGGCGPPDCEWFLLVALVVTVSTDPEAQQRPLLLAAGLAVEQGGSW